MTKDITRIIPKGNISVCPNCGYKDGFHVSFNIKENSTEAETILICPDCHQYFQIGWTVFFNQ